MFAKVPRTYGSSDSPDSTPAWRGTVAIERMERAVLNRVRAQSAWLLFGPLVGLLIAVGYVLSKPAMYEASASVRLVPSSLLAPPPPGLPPGYTYYGAQAIRPHQRQDELQILTSRTFLTNLARTLSPELQRRLLGDDPKNYATDELRRALVAELGGGLSVFGNNENELMEIAFDHEDRDLTAEIVKQFIKSAQLVGLHMGEDRNRRAASLFAGQITTLKQKIRDARDRETAIERGNDVARRQAQRNAGAPYEFEFGTEDTDPQLVPLMKAAARARLQRALAQREVRLLEALGKDGRESDATLPELQALREHLTQAENEFAALGATKGPNQPEMQGRAAAVASYRQKLEEAANKQLNVARTAVAEAAENAKTMTDESIRHQVALTQIQKEQVRDAMLEIDLALNLTVYEAIEAKLQESRINAGLGATDLQVIDEPTPPEKPLPRAFVMPITFGVLIGFVIGGLATLWLQQRGLRRWTLAQMEDTTLLPVLTVLAESKSGVAGPRNEGEGSEFEDGLMLLENEVLLMPEHGRPDRRAEVMLFTSAAPSEGKTAAISTYATLSARRGQRVLLIDADMHKPAVHKFFGLSGRRGLSTLLAGRIAFTDALLRVGKLDVLVAGPVPPSPSDLLGVKAFADLLEEVGSRYDLVLIDSPPVLALMDAVTMAADVDLVLLVTRYGVVTLAQVARARNLLGRTGAPVGGLIINGAPAK